MRTVFLFNLELRMPTCNKNPIANRLHEDQSIGKQNFFQADDMPVTCESFETQVNNLLDGRNELSSNSALRFHANECVGCRQTLLQYEQLELVLGSTRTNTLKADVDLRSDVNLRGARLCQSKRWLRLATTAALLALFVFTSQYMSQRTNVEAELSVPLAAESQMDLLKMDSIEVETASSFVLPKTKQVSSWSSPAAVGQLREWVDSGSELFAAGRDQAAVIQGLSDVKLDFDLDLVETRLTALRPMLTYSGRIPVLSPMQGTVCFTLGWLKKDKAVDQPKLDFLPVRGADLGMHSRVLAALT